MEALLWVSGVAALVVGGILFRRLQHPSWGAGDEPPPTHAEVEEMDALVLASREAKAEADRQLDELLRKWRAYADSSGIPKRSIEYDNVPAWFHQRLAAEEAGDSMEAKVFYLLQPAAGEIRGRRERFAKANPGDPTYKYEREFYFSWLGWFYRKKIRPKLGDFIPKPMVRERMKEYTEKFLARTEYGAKHGWVFDHRDYKAMMAIKERLDRTESGPAIPTEGIEFERYCARRLRNLGWAVETTPPTGDQGVDLVARRDGRTVAVQCKRHSRPVGNEAVQQVFAGMHYLGADEAAVISTGGYTASARELAAQTGVRLLTSGDVEVAYA